MKPANLIRPLVLASVILAAASILVLVGAGGVTSAAANGNSITVADNGEDAGYFASMVLDASGDPTFAFFDRRNGDLRHVRCADPDCDNVVASFALDTTGNVGQFTSIALDAAGHPVISYYRGDNGNLKLLHCDDVNCTPAGNSITAPDTAGKTGLFTSLVLDGGGNPAVSYFNETLGELRILRCNDPNCDGGGDTINAVDSGMATGMFTSLALDGAGNPVISYVDGANKSLKIAHCNDGKCSGGDESITTPDAAGVGASDTSLVLDASGHPVVAYHDEAADSLNILHCNDPDCAPGGDSITSPDLKLEIGRFASLVLDPGGNPVVSYYAYGTGDLRILHCNDPNCAGDDESITTPDTAGDVGAFTSLVLDGSGHPVAGYVDVTAPGNANLKALHCDDALCAGDDEAIALVGNFQDVGGQTSLALDSAGNPVVSYNEVADEGFQALRLLHCNDPVCDGEDESITSHFTGEGGGGDTVAIDSSMVLDKNGHPLVSHEEALAGILTLLICGDPDCAGGGEGVAEPGDSDGGRYSSLILDGDGFPVISYHDATSQTLKLLHCNDAACSGGNEFINTPDPGSDTGTYTSLKLDSSGRRPVVSYHDQGAGALKLLHCNDANCAGSDDSITTPDSGDVGAYSSLAIDGEGNPVVGYYDENGGDLKVLHCDDPDCAPGGDSITTPDPDDERNVGGYISLVLDAAGHPVISYYDFSTMDLKVMHCNDPNCAGQDETVASPDTEGDVGLYTSLQLDSDGFPVVSYVDATNGAVKLLHCGTADCLPAPEATPTPTGTLPATPDGTTTPTATAALTPTATPPGGGLDRFVYLPVVIGAE